MDSANPKDRIAKKKPPLALVPAALLIHTSGAMADGGRKYGPYNFRQSPIKGTVYIEAAMRHLLALLDGENVAQDSLVHHMGHVAACAAIYLDAMETGNLIDDRPLPGPASRLIAYWRGPQEKEGKRRSGNILRRRLNGTDHGATSRKGRRSGILLSGSIAKRTKARVS